MNLLHPRSVATLALVMIALAGATESRAQLDLTHQRQATFEASTETSTEESAYSYAATLRIPRRDVHDLEALIRRHVSPLVERRGALIAGPYRILIEAEGLEYVVQILTTEVPPKVQERLQEAVSPAFPSDELVEPIRPIPTAGLSERREGDSRTP